MGISDIIASFISEMIAETNGIAEIQRAELANKFNCVPSQINYVISTRFSPEHGYVVESRRGGNGYIRISRVTTDPKRLIMHTINAIGDELDYNTAEAFVSNLNQSGIISENKARLILAAIGHPALRPAPRERQDELRASILKQILINVYQ